ncbi:tRNA preQ1(34) S-adenosylmethionine ribosyltransferase-isomerase QueA [Candidatus Hydrogenedentota bacterium]
MYTSDFDYDLPESLIAQHPLEQRDTSRLLVVDRDSDELHVRTFPDILEYLNPGDTLIVNDTKVIPARLRARKTSGARIELLLVTPVANNENEWEAMIRPAKRVRPGMTLELESDSARIEVLERPSDERWRVRFTTDDVMALLDRAGEMPLPPYIRRDAPSVDDRLRYQTVYAEKPGAIAAPTAGLHFTPELLDKARAKGVDTGAVTLHIGPGTFVPIKVDRVVDHVMHSERYELPAETVDLVEKTHARGGRVVAVGTTTCRVLEHAATEGAFEAHEGEADIFIVPGYKFKVIDSLVTNFHLPKSTLLMLVSTFGGVDLIRVAYRKAVEEEFRFYSYGDAMLII